LQRPVRVCSIIGHVSAQVKVFAKNFGESHKCPRGERCYA
jgi:hypothetical protein